MSKRVKPRFLQHIVFFMVLSLLVACFGEAELANEPNLIEPAAAVQATDTPVAEAEPEETATPMPEPEPEATATLELTTTDITNTIDITNTDAVTNPFSAEMAITSTLGITNTTDIFVGPVPQFGVREASGAFVRATDFLGYTVENLEGDNLGEIEDAVINLADGGIVFVNLSYGGFLDIGDEIYPIPLNAFSWNPVFSRMILDIPEETLENAPGFADDWPDLTTARWDAGVDQFWRETDFGINTRRPTSRGVRSIAGTGIRLSNLLDRDVQDFEGENLGEIEDMIIDLENGDIAYAIISFGGFLGLGEDRFAIPLNAFDLNLFGPEGYRADLILEITEAELLDAPRFDDDLFDAGSSDWDTDIRQFWNLEVPAIRETAPRVSTDAENNVGIAGTLLPALNITDNRTTQLGNIIGSQVENVEGEVLGTIEDMVLALGTADISYILLSPMDETSNQANIPIPAGALLRNPDNDRLLMNTDMTDLMAAPRLEDEVWPVFGRATLEDDVYSYWVGISDAISLYSPTVPPRTTVAGLPARVLTTSSLFEKPVQNRDGEEVGRIEDLIFSQGLIRYVVVAYDDASAHNNRLIMPLYALIFNGAEDTFILDEQLETLDEAPQYADATWPNLQQPNWDADIIAFWNDTGLTADIGFRQVASTIMSGNDLIGYDVIDVDRNTIGNIEDLLIDSMTGDIRYALMSFGGFLGLGEEHYPIPLNRLTINPYSNEFSTDITEAELENAPMYNEGLTSDPTWTNTLDGFWAMDEVAIEPAINANNIALLSNLWNYNVIGVAGEDIAEVDDIMVDFLKSGATHLVLGVGGFLEIGEKEVAVPIDMITIDTAEGVIHFDATPEQLENAPTFDPSLWSQVGNNIWRIDANNYWTN